MIDNQAEKISYKWLLIFIIISTFAIFSAGFDHDVVYYGVLLMAIATGIGVFINNDNIEINKVLITFSLFTLWAFVSIFWSISPIRTAIEGIQLIAFLLVYIISRIISKEGLDKLFKVLLLVSGGIAFLGILEYLFVSGSRILATFTNPNPFGIYMVMIFLVVLSLSIRNKSKSYFVLSVLFLSVVLLSGSRASIGALAVSLIIVFFGLDRSQIKGALIKSLAIFISAFVFSQISLYASIFIRENVFLDQSLLDSITRSSSFITSSLKGRLEFWRVAFDLFKNKPMTGL
jgi:O-antigen ligase